MRGDVEEDILHHTEADFLRMSATSPTCADLVQVKKRIVRRVPHPDLLFNTKLRLWLHVLRRDNNVVEETQRHCRENNVVP